MELLILVATVLLLWTTALAPMLRAANENAELEFRQCIHRFKLRAIKKYHGNFQDDPHLHGLSLDEIERHFAVQPFYDDIGRP